MNLHPDVSTQIIEKAKALGASLAGIASIAALKDSPSYEIYHKSPYYAGYEKVEWSVEAESVLVLALVHDPSEPELDWWDYKPGRTPGLRILISMAKRLRQWMKEEFNINSRSLPYRVENGGVLLKDAAVLAGLGTIGKSNLLITPEYGPQVRLKAMFLVVDLEPTGPIDFDPCGACDMPCRRACPQQAFRDGSYSRALCDVQMGEDEANEVIVETSEDEDILGNYRMYCRACELACPVA